MTHKCLQAIKTYAFVILFILGWWVLAFNTKSDRAQAARSQSSAVTAPPSVPLDTAITAIDRHLLHQALAGDCQLMARLIADWDIDAQILLAKGFQGITRLPHPDFLQSQSLIRTLQNEEAIKKSTSLHHEHHLSVSDDVGHEIPLNPPYQRFLPQTYVAASFLLSLVPVKQIVALPRSLRDQTHLYPSSLTKQIPLDIDRYHGEKLFQARPDIAFVAHYSHPDTIQALNNQGTLLYTMKNLMTLSDISEELIRVGNIANKPLQAELLKIFIDAAIIALDNQQTVFTRHFEKQTRKLPTVLVVNFHHSFSVPTTNTLTGQLLSRMSSIDLSLKYAKEHNHSNEWMAMIDRERLLKLNPDFLIIATDNVQALEKEIDQDHSLHGLAAIRNRRFVVVNHSIQNSPSQYVVLAYHDLIYALMNLL